MALADETGRVLGFGACGEHATDIDHIVGDDGHPDPPLHAVVPFVAAAIQSVSAFDDTDATLTTRAPLLPRSKPALLLFTPALRILRRPVRDADPLHAPF